MGAHTNLGKEGEEYAGTYLESMGFCMIEKNWRYGHLEIDLLGTRNGILHIFEVKTKRSLRGGYPEGRVDRKKFRLIQLAAEAYLAMHPAWKRIQFNIVSVIIPPGGEPRSIFLIEDVFFWD